MKDLRGIEKLITQSDELQTKLKVTENLEFCVTNPSGLHHLVCRGATKVVRDKIELTLEATLKMGEETYYVGDYIRFVWHNPYEIYGPPDYEKNEAIGKINAFYFDDERAWVGLNIDAHYREYGTNTPFNKLKHEVFTPQQIKPSSEKLTEEEYQKYLHQK